MAEAIGLAAAILQIAQLGLSCSQALYKFSHSVSNHSNSIDRLKSHVETNSQVLSRLGDLLHKSFGLNQNLQDDIEMAAKSCRRVFEQILKVFDSMTVSKTGLQRAFNKAKYAAFLDTQVKDFRQELQECQVTLSLMLHIHWQSSVNDTRHAVVELLKNGLDHASNSQVPVVADTLKEIVQGLALDQTPSKESTESRSLSDATTLLSSRSSTVSSLTNSLFTTSISSRLPPVDQAKSRSLQRQDSVDSTIDHHAGSADTVRTMWSARLGKDKKLSFELQPVSKELIDSFVLERVGKLLMALAELDPAIATDIKTHAIRLQEVLLAIHVYRKDSTFGRRKLTSVDLVTEKQLLPPSVPETSPYMSFLHSHPYQSAPVEPLLSESKPPEPSLPNVEPEVSQPWSDFPPHSETELAAKKKKKTEAAASPSTPALEPQEIQDDGAVNAEALAALKPVPAAAPSGAAPEPAPKPSFFRDRIAAFNTPHSTCTAAKHHPVHRAAGPIPPPPSRDAYVPPTREPVAPPCEDKSRRGFTTVRTGKNFVFVDPTARERRLREIAVARETAKRRSRLPHFDQAFQDAIGSNKIDNELLDNTSDVSQSTTTTAPDSEGMPNPARNASPDRRTDDYIWIKKSSKGHELDDEDPLEDDPKKLAESLSDADDSDDSTEGEAFEGKRKRRISIEPDLTDGDFSWNTKFKQASESGFANAFSRDDSPDLTDEEEVEDDEMGMFISGPPMLAATQVVGPAPVPDKSHPYWANLPPPETAYPVKPPDQASEGTASVSDEEPLDLTSESDSGDELGAWTAQNAADDAASKGGERVDLDAVADELLRRLGERWNSAGAREAVRRGARH